MVDDKPSVKSEVGLSSPDSLGSFADGKEAIAKALAETNVRKSYEVWVVAKTIIQILMTISPWIMLYIGLLSK